MRYGYETTDGDSYQLLKVFAKENKRNSTEAERALWEMLRGHNLGVHFRRQHPIGCFIADFVCLKKKLIIEVDGGYHSEKEQQESDGERTKILEFQGYKVIRFTNEEVIGNTKEVLHIINKYIDEQTKKGL